MRDHHLRTMRYSALNVFRIINTVVKADDSTLTPHHQLLWLLSNLFKVPTIRFVEGYQTFLDELSSNNEALDSWCKLLGVFTSELGEDAKELSIKTIKDLFTTFAEMHPSLSNHFKVSGEPDMSQVLAYMLCIVQSTEFDDFKVVKHG